jgi:hypothetical protein
MSTIAEKFVVVWFPPEGDRERTFTLEVPARTFAAKRGVGDWNPILLRRVTVTDVTETMLDLEPYDPEAIE